MCWWCGLRIPSGEGSSAMSTNQEKHSAHRSKSCICVFVLTWLEHDYSTRRAATCKPLLDKRYRAQIVQKCMLSVSFLCRECVYSQITVGWSRLRHLFMQSGSRNCTLGRFVLYSARLTVVCRSQPQHLSVDRSVQAASK